MKNEIMSRIEQRPENGCARCLWWLQDRRDDWGRCTMHHDRTWWRHAACGDYDKDPFAEDTIQLTGKEE